MDRLLKMDLEKHLHRGATHNKSLLIILELQKKISPNTLITTIIIQIIDNHQKKTQVCLHATVTCTTLKYALYLFKISFWTSAQSISFQEYKQTFETEVTCGLGEKGLCLISEQFKMKLSNFYNKNVPVFQFSWDSTCSYIRP